jgi:hypothetical protein
MHNQFSSTKKISRMVLFVPLLVGQLLPLVAKAHPLKGSELASFSIYHKFVECALHGPFADIASGVSSGDLKGEATSPAVKKKIADWLNSGMFSVKPDGQNIPMEVTAAYYYEGQSAKGDSFEIDLKYPTAKPAKKLTVTAQFNPETIISVGGTSRKLTTDRPTDTFDTNANLDSLWKNLQDFTYMGMEHLFTGFDHMLFICTLIFAAASLKDVVKLLTAFTIGHGITLILTTFNVFNVNPRLVDIGIAGTIVFVALQNILTKKEIHGRWLIVFVFGLIHGMGFSASLREMGLPQQGLVLCLLSFNVGIELAQIIIVACIFPILSRVRWMKERLRGEKGVTQYRQLLAYGNVFTALIGGYWLVQRVFGIG